LAWWRLGRRWPWRLGRRLAWRGAPLNLR
jgi:hypothetical protein